MSINFYVNPGSVTGYKVRCFCGEGSIDMDSYEDAESYLIMWHMENTLVPGCSNEYGDCTAYIPLIVASFVNSDIHEVEMSSFNARDVMNELGLEEESGEIDPDEILSRALVQLALGEISPTRETVVEGNSVMCGRKEGYVQDKISGIVELAEIAKARNTTVMWS